MSKIKINCDECGKNIEVYPHKLKNYKFHFCSKECKNKSKKIKEEIGKKNKKHMKDKWSKGIAYDLFKINLNKGRLSKFKGINYEERFGIEKSKEIKDKIGNTTRELYKKGLKRKTFLGKKHSKESLESNRIAHLGKKQSEETKLKRGLYVSGKNHPSWKGGLTPLNKKIRNSTEYKLWRQAIFERDGYTCIWCGAKSQKGTKVTLNADHIKPFSLFPELRFAIDNGRTLCLDCHKKTDTYSHKLLSRDNKGKFVKELRDRKLVLQSGNKVDQITKKQVSTWKVKRRLR